MNRITKTLQVTGMSCNSCVRHVEETLGELRGVEGTGVDLDREMVRVAYRPNATSIATIEEALLRAGYEVVGEVEPPKERTRRTCCGCCG